MSMASYISRRQQLLTQMQAQGGGVTIIPTAREMIRNSDNFFPFRHDSYFYYLSGFTEPDALIVLIANGTQQRSILFCREKNPEREIWDGYRFGPSAAKDHFGFDETFVIDALDAEMPILLADARTLFYSAGNDTQLDSRLHIWMNAVRARSRSGIIAPSTTIDVRQLLDEMRLRKDTSEVRLMQKAADISGVAHTRAMQSAHPGRYEYELEAEVHHEFRRQGSQAPAYGSIIAAGSNACILHYSSNSAQINDGDLILIDAGCEFDSYASDITRTFPANGKFSSAQRTLYEIVLAAQQAALEYARPGSRYMDGHDAAVRVLTEGMLDTGLVDKNKVGSVQDAITSLAFRQFYMHGTGHWLGLDVHDVGSYHELNKVGDDKHYRKLESGMVITVEPGIYVRPAGGIPEKFWNIGIRIEDDILITPQGHINLSRDTPKTVAEIESVMN